MSLQPIDLPSLLRSVIWPLLAIFALIVLRHPLSALVTILGQRIHKFSVGGFSLELAEVSEVKTQTLETEIRQLDAGVIPESGSSAISQLLWQLQTGRPQDYIVIDLGTEASPRWITSRLYLLALLITLINRSICMVFVETLGDVRKRFIGTAFPDRVRWALARRYSWLESASAAPYATVGGAYCNLNFLTLNPLSTFQFNPTTGGLEDLQVTQLMQQFLSNVRAPAPPPTDKPSEWMSLNDGLYEHAKWVHADRLERFMGPDLSTSRVVLMPNQDIDDLGETVLKQQGSFVAVVEPDRTFRGLVDRLAVMESMTKEFLKAVGKQAPGKDQ